MTDRCQRCDRTKCNATVLAERAQALHDAGDPDAFEAWYESYGELKTCLALANDWRTEALASRALLREMIEFNHGIMHDVSPDMAGRIRDHLAGKP
jgi:hypothetical protein